MRLNGERIREMRIANMLSQQQLADEVGCGKRTLEKVEKGEPVTAKIARVIAEKLGVELSTLSRAATASYLDRRRESSRFRLMTTVARKVANELEAQAPVAVSSGVTVALAVAEAARTHKRPLVVTNNVGVVDELSREQLAASVTLAGGEYNPWIHACIGKDAVRCFLEIRIPQALVGLSGITADGRLYVLYKDDVPVYEALVESVTDKIIIACDVSKFLHQKVFLLGKLSDWCCGKQVEIVTNPHSMLGDSATAKLAKDNLEKLASNFPQCTITYAD